MYLLSFDVVNHIKVCFISHTVENHYDINDKDVERVAPLVKELGIDDVPNIRNSGKFSKVK